MGKKEIYTSINEWKNKSNTRKRKSRRINEKVDGDYIFDVRSIVVTVTKDSYKDGETDLVNEWHDWKYLYGVHQSPEEIYQMVIDDVIPFYNDYTIENLKELSQIVDGRLWIDTLAYATNNVDGPGGDDLNQLKPDTPEYELWKKEELHGYNVAIDIRINIYKSVQVDIENEQQYENILLK